MRAVAAAVLALLMLVVLASRMPYASESDAHHQHAEADHQHADVPRPYAGLHAPPGVWTDPAALALGKRIYHERCAVCHNDNGDGHGSGAHTLPVKPPDLRDAKMVAHMSDSYWFWRVSEGGREQPFRSMGSAMPAWKDVLSVRERWAVIAYQHTLSGHRGPHTATAHPELRDVVPAASPGHSHGH